jgi:hypothetical protein
VFVLPFQWDERDDNLICFLLCYQEHKENRSELIVSNNEIQNITHIEIGIIKKLFELFIVM